MARNKYLRLINEMMNVTVDDYSDILDCRAKKILYILKKLINNDIGKFVLRKKGTMLGSQDDWCDLDFEKEVDGLTLDRVIGGKKVMIYYDKKPFILIQKEPAPVAIFKDCYYEELNCDCRFIDKRLITIRTFG